MEKLQEIYCEYTETLGKVIKKTSPLAGIFGTGGGAKSHPCHEAFYENVGQWVETFLAQQPEEADVADAVHFMLIAAAAHKGEPTYSLCFAAQGHAKKLIGLLSKEDCAALQEEYDSLYPESVRLPVNQQVYDMLRAGSGIPPKKKGLFSFLKT